MRICILSLTYPPRSTDGIPRQRQILATSLAQLGHDVHVVYCGSATYSRMEGDVQVHEVAFEPLEHYLDQWSGLDDALTRSQRLYEGLVAQSKQQPFDIVDVPMWMAQGFVTLHRYPGPTVIWLQTTYAQLLAINGRQRTPIDQAVIDLERACLERAAGILGDSQAAIEAIRADYTNTFQGIAGLAYIGIPPTTDHRIRTMRPTIELLVVGRLEKRKGTPFLFELLPSLLKMHPRVVVRFVGRDNSASDGWHARHQMGYDAFFCKRYPKLIHRVIFEGHVSEETLQQRYQEADILLVPSIYESFGIIYLEAMRVGLPVITFASGGANEIYAAGEQHGAILVPPGNHSSFKAAITHLVQNPMVRQQLGESGRQRFLANFTDQAMARTTLTFYQQVIQHVAHERGAEYPIYQVVTALYTGDAVSTIALHNARILAELGLPGIVLSQVWPEQLQTWAAPLDQVLRTVSCGLIMHYAGYTSTAWMVAVLRGRKAIHYHNITPASFFVLGSDMHEHLQLGYAQLRQLVNQFDLIIGDTDYNVQDLARYLQAPKPSLVLYPVIEVATIQQSEYDPELLRSLRSTPGIKLIFVGRIAPNKRQHRLIELLAYLCHEIDPQAQLWLIGNEQFDPEYRTLLEQVCNQLAIRERVTFVGKVPDTILATYYRAADIFVCASEHEGFCVPIAEAMAYNLPVIAYASSAIPETMGGAGILISEWNVEVVSTHIQQLMLDPQVRAAMVAIQQAVLGRFSQAEAQQRLAAVVRFLQTGELSSLFGSVPESGIIL